MNLEIEFKIQPSQSRRRDRPELIPYPFREQAVCRAAYNKSVYTEVKGTKVCFWKELMMLRAEFELQHLLNRQVLDRLIEPEDADPRSLLELQETPRRFIQNALRKRLSVRDETELRLERRKQQLANSEPDTAQMGELECLDAKDIGVTVLRVTLGHLQIHHDFAEAVEKIRKLRAESWRAEWLKQGTIRQAEGEAARTRTQEGARAQAQAEMLHAIARGLEGMDEQSRANISHVLALRTIEALEQMTLDPWSQIFIPEQTMEMLRRLRELYI